MSGHGRPGLLRLFPAATMLFLYAPIVVVALFSFNSKRSLAQFGHPSLTWYDRAFQDHDLWASVGVSLQIAIVTSLGAVVLGATFAIALDRLRTKAAGGGGMLIALMLITPEVSLGFSLLLMLTTIGVPLSRWTVVLGHITFAIPLVVIVLRARLATLGGDVEEAAMDLGATRWATVRLVVLPQLLPALAGSAMLVFVLSFDDFVVSLFLSGTGTSPLPVRIYSMLRFGLTPEINAIATLMMVVSIVVGVGAVALTRYRP